MALKGRVGTIGVYKIKIEIQMKILVTGGAGFIGSNLCEHLLGTEYAVLGDSDRIINNK